MDTTIFPDEDNWVYADSLDSAAPLLVIDGPEKAGKSTVISSLITSHPKLTVMHWGKCIRGDYFSGPRDFLTSFRNCQEGAIPSVWDRSWVANWVYGTMGANPELNQLAHNVWLGEWMLGRALPTCGLGVILLGPSAESNAGLHDASDLQVNALGERTLFESYGKRYHYYVTANQHDKHTLDALAGSLWGLARLTFETANTPPLAWTGRAFRSPIVFLESPVKESPRWYRGVLPWSDSQGTAFAQAIGSEVFDCAWGRTHVSVVPRLKEATTVFCRDKEAQDFAQKYNKTGSIILMPEGLEYSQKILMNFIRREIRAYKDKRGF